jgi:hypothetical protein
MGAYAQHWDPGGHENISLSGLYYMYVHYILHSAPFFAVLQQFRKSR